MRKETIAKTILCAGVALAITSLAGCGCDPKTKVIVVEPEAVIASNVYVRTPASAGMPTEYGGAALRQADRGEYTLNDCEFCPGYIPNEESEQSGLEVKTVNAPEENATGANTKTVVTTEKVIKKKKTIRRKAKKAKTTQSAKANNIKSKTEVIDCDLYRQYCEPQSKNKGKDAEETVERVTRSVILR